MLAPICRNGYSPLVRMEQRIVMFRNNANSCLVLLRTATAVLIFSSLGSRCQAGPYREAPMLRELVEQGKLPPVRQRLPEQPAVVQPYEKIGVYGGQMRTVTGQPEAFSEQQYMLYEPLLRFASDGVTIVPNVVRHWEMSEDAKSITLFLRKGMRWSDGAPVTVEDVLFAWQDVILNEDIVPPSLFPPAFKAGGRPMELERVDDFSFRLVFAEPYGAIPYLLTRTVRDQTLILPKHYLKNYHPKYTPMKELMAKAKQAGFANWFELFRDVNHSSRLAWTSRMPPDYPMISAWHVAEVPAIDHVILQRNPYYWKVDPQGNQLPYIDRIHSIYIGNPEARNLRYITGQIDFAAIYCRMNDTPLFLSNRRKGNYRVYFWREDMGSRTTYHFNQTHPDPVLRKIFQDKRFRIALSLAIDRQDINKMVYFGKCRPMQVTVNRICSFFEPEFATSYAQYDPERANQLLDEMGLQRRGPGGWRYRPDGKQLVISLDAIANELRGTKTAELVKEHWKAVGVLLNWRMVTEHLMMLRMRGNLADMLSLAGDVSMEVMVLQKPLFRIKRWAPLWYRWLHSQGQQGEEPPQQIKDLYKLWEDLRKTADPKERIRLGKKLVRSQAENLWGIGTVGETFDPTIVSNRLHNVPQFIKDKDGNLLEGEPALWGWPWFATFLHHPEQFYIEED